MVEAGLGGRHDATNVLGAPVVVLTNVGLEHTRWLGPTVPDIAREKLAVVRPRRHAGDRPDRPRGARAGRPDRRRGRAGAARRGRPGRLPARQLRGRGGRRARPARRARPGAGGRGRRARAGPGTDAGGRRAAADHLRRRAQPVGHAGARARRSTPTSSSPWCRSSTTRTPRACCGRCSGRRWEPCSRAPCNPRALSPATLASLAEQLGGPPSEIVPDPHAAVARAQELAGPDGAVLATGSIYLVADLLGEPGRRRASAL